MTEKHSPKKAFYKPEISFRHLSFVLGACLVVFIGIVAGCGGSGSSSSSDAPRLPIEDALWIGVQGGENGDWQEFVCVSTIDELNELEVQQATTGAVTFKLEDFSLDISDNGGDGKYAIAFVMASADAQEVTSFIFMATITELSSIDFSSFLAGKNATLQTSMGTTTSDYYVSMFFINAYSMNNPWTPSSAPDFDFDSASGTYDLAAIRTGQSDSTAYLLLFRDESLNTDNTATIGPIAEDDFTDSGFLLSDYTITIETDLDFDGEMNLVTANGTDVLLGEGDGDGGTSTFDFKANDAALTGDDMYMLHLYMDIDEDSASNYYRAFASAGNKNVTPSSVTFDGYFISTNSNSSGSLLPGLTGTPLAADVIGYTAQYQGNADGVDYMFSMHVSSGRADEHTNLSTISFYSPDMESINGWDSRWSIPGTTAMDWTIVSVQIGDTDLTTLANWYYTGHPGFLTESWFASIYNFVDEGSTTSMLGIGDSSTKR